jgi:hypothetical protein
MKENPDDVVKVASADMVTIELHKQLLTQAGIDARVVGKALGSSFGSAIPGSVELWVHRSDAKRAEALIAEDESKIVKESKVHQEHEHFPHPTSDPLPKGHGGHGPHTHYNADPHG